MGIYADVAEKYHQHGIYTIPCQEKRPLIGLDWQKYCESPPTEKDVETWVRRFPNANQVGLLLGKSSGFVAFDFDYEWDQRRSALDEKAFYKDRKLIEPQIISLLPQTPAIKVGRKGWTRIFRCHPSLAQNSNRSPNRHGVRLFDFLSWHKQTIIPPSVHSVEEDRSLLYKWIGVSIEECLDDIPEITIDVVQEIEMMFKTGADKTECGGRHGKLLYWLLDVITVERDFSKLATRLIEKDLKLNPDSPYLSDEKHHRSGDAEKNAKLWIERIARWMDAKKTLKIKSAAKGADAWDYFFENQFPAVKKDIVSKSCFIKTAPSEEWTPITSIEGALKSYANRASLPDSKTTDELERWTLEKTKLGFLCDIPEWDRIDRVQQCGAAINSAQFTPEEIGQILKHWGSNIFRRVKSPYSQNRCIILKGPQGIGKDYLVRSMLKDFKPYYESTTLPGTQKDALEIVSRLLAVHIEEFDQTKHMDVAFLKSLITQPAAFFREAYGHSPNQKIMRPSFISTANVDDILRDPTGNRRFIVIPVSRIEWGYPTDQSLQIMAQFKAHFEAGEFEALSDDLEAKIKAITESYTPEDLSVAIAAVFQQRFNDILSHNNHTGDSWDLVRSSRQLRGGQAIEILTRIAKDLNCSLRKVQSSLKGCGLSRHSRDGAIYFPSTHEATNWTAKPAKNS